MSSVEESGFSSLALEVLDSAPVGMAIVTGPTHRVIYTNSVYRSAFGHKPVGEPFHATLSDRTRRRYFSLLDRVLKTGDPVYLAEALLSPEYSGAETPKRYFDMSLSAISLSSGERGVLIVLMDSTAQASSAHRSRSFQRYERLARAGTQVEWVASPTDGSVKVSRGWHEMTGQIWEEYSGFGWLRVVHPDDRTPLMGAWFKAVKQTPEVFEHTCRLRVLNGGYRHFHIRGVPVREEGSETVVEWVGTCADVEDQWREQRRRNLLARVSSAMADAPYLDDMLTALARVLVPEIADGCAIYLVSDPTQRSDKVPVIAERVATARRAGLPALATHREERFNPDSAFSLAIQRQRPVYGVYTPTAPVSDLVPTGARSWLTITNANSIAIVPLVLKGTTFATVTLAVCGRRTPISGDDVDLVVEALSQVEAPLSKVIEFQRTQRVALALQRYLLNDPPDIPGLSIAARYRPSPDAAEVGGDWYDSFSLPDGSVMLAIGDVAGHDLNAAVAMSQLRDMLRGFSVDSADPPGDILQRLDSAMTLLYRGITATCVLARLVRADDGRWRASYSVAGHLPPLLIPRTGDPRFLETTDDLLLGAFPEHSRTTITEALPPDCTVLFYTDGLVERPGQPIDEGLSQLGRHAAALAGKPPDSFCDELLTRVGAAGHDDIAVMAFRTPPDLFIPAPR